MGNVSPDRDARDANLKALLKTLKGEAGSKGFVQKEQERLENEVKFLRAVLNGRGASAAATTNLADTTKTAVYSINQFLFGIPSGGQ